uniref:Uncharacterized protein n=1 Tax=Rhizochromulina marina TaxID=1034831 RepID=A0A7S2SU08_9STRA
MSASTAAEELFGELRRLAPHLPPQIRPAASALGGSVDPVEAVAGCFESAAQRREFLTTIRTMVQKKSKQEGRKVGFVPVCRVDPTRGRVTVDKFLLVGEVQATLSNLDAMLQLQLHGSPAELEPYVTFFGDRNRSEEPARDMQEALNVAYSAQVVVDNMPGWATRIGEHKVPVPSNVPVRQVISELCEL